MGKLLDGKWVSAEFSGDEKGRFVRGQTAYREKITRDGSSGFAPEAGRYHLYVSWACPWAHRTIIMRKLKKLESTVGMSVAQSFMGDDGWEFGDEYGSIADDVNDASYLRDVYLAADAAFTGRVTVPVLWDKQKKTIVNNESREIIRMFDTELDDFADPTINFCPPELRDKVDATIDAIFDPINNGVYRAGFGRSQEAYDEAVTELFEALDYWESVLGEQRYLCGHVPTEADWCLFTTLIRFDLVYHYHFKCNVRRVQDYPNLWNYTKELYQWPGVSEACNFDHIRRHYYRSHESINPHRIVPRGPIIDFTEPHDRARLD